MDNTMFLTCLDILDWMREQEEFADIVYVGSKGIGERRSYKDVLGEEGVNQLVERLYRQLSRVSFKSGLEFLTKDMYVDTMEKMKNVSLEELLRDLH